MTSYHEEPALGGRDRALAVLATATALSTYALVVLGSTVRVTNSGMGCPSWPLCYGHVGPVDQYHALVEQSHRYLVALVTVGVVATALRARRPRTRRVAFRPAVVAAALVVAQAGLGALTVLAKNAPWTVAAHLVLGLVFFATTVVTAVAAWRGGQAPWSPSAVGCWAWAALATTLATIVAGSLVVANGAVEACPSWPLCPKPAAGVAWHLLHRSLAGACGVGIAAFVVNRWHLGARLRAWRAIAVALGGCFAAVVGIGAGSALTRGAPAWQDAHLAAVALLWGALVTLATLSASVPAAGSRLVWARPSPHANSWRDLTPGDPLPRS